MELSRIYGISVINVLAANNIVSEYDNDSITKDIIKTGVRQLRNRTDSHITVNNGIM